MTEEGMQEVLEKEAISRERKFLTFALGGEEYGIDISNVVEIIGIQKITPLPDVDNYVKGVINLRGKVYPVIDVRLRFGFEEKPYDERTCIIVVNVKDASVGLIVDNVSEVLDIPESDIEPPVAIKKGKGSRFVSGIGKVGDKVVVLLDMDRLLFEEEIEAISKAMR